VIEKHGKMNHYVDNSGARPKAWARRPRYAIRNPKSAIRNGFTLIEMLVAVLILSVGIALIVGVATVVREHSRNAETRNIQAVLASALKLYHDSPGISTWPAGDGTADSTAELLRSLRTQRASRAELAKLPSGAILEDDAGREFVLDGYGNKMRYFRTGGLAGATPLISSLGADPKDPADDINTDVN